MITVYYDGACGLCSKEINYYRSIAPEGVFDWCDVMQSPEALKQEGMSLSSALMQLHAKDRDGVMHQGVDAFVLMWRQIGHWRWLARLISLPLVKQTAQFLYGHFCKWRFARLDHCIVAKQHDGTAI